MATAKLTQTLINSLETPAKGYWLNDEALSGLRLYVGSSGIKTYYLTYKNIKGKKDSFKIGDEKLFTPTQARETAKKFLADMSVSGKDIKRERKNVDKITLKQAREAYKAAGKSNVALEATACFESFFDYPAELITTFEIEAWRAKEKSQKNIKDATLNKQTTCLKAILNFAADRRLITANPLAKLKKLKETDSKVKTRYLTADERNRFYAALDKYDERARAARKRTRQHTKGKHLPSTEDSAFANFFKPVIILSMNTGIRRHALLSLRWDDVDLNAGTVLLRAENAKSKKSDVLPLNTTALNTLRQWHNQRTEDNPLVFPSSIGTVMRDCKKPFEWLLKEAEIKDFTWHDMRHDFASRLVMAGVDLNTVRELMTHSDISMTLRYAHLAPEKKKEAVERINELPN